MGESPSDAAAPRSGAPDSPPPRAAIVRPYPLPEPRPGEFYVEPIDPASLIETPIFCIERDDPFDHYAYRVRSILHESKTAFQSVVIADSYNYGRVLFMDGVVQS